MNLDALLAAAQGGDIAQGTVTGAYEMMFNELMHDYRIDVEKIKMEKLINKAKTLFYPKSVIRI